MEDSSSVSSEKLKNLEFMPCRNYFLYGHCIVFAEVAVELLRCKGRWGLGMHYATVLSTIIYTCTSVVPNGVLQAYTML